MNTKHDLDALYRVIHGIEAKGVRWEAGERVKLRDLPAQARAHLIKHGHIAPVVEEDADGTTRQQ